MDTVLTNARLVLDDAVVAGTITLRDGRILAIDAGRATTPAAIDCDGDFIAPGLIDLHTDALEGHFVPRPKVFWPDARAAALAHDGQTVASGITTVFDAICAGGFDQAKAERRELFGTMLDAVEQGAPLFRADHKVHLRCEMTDPNVLDLVEPTLARPSLAFASLMDHTPGARQWRNVETLRNFLLGIGKDAGEAEREIGERTARGRANVARNMPPLVEMLASTSLVRASHDDTTEAHVAEAQAAGCTISEFPTTREAALAARAADLATIGGAPNVVRGGSHSGGVAMGALAQEGLVDALAADYVPASLLQAATRLHTVDGMALPQAIALVTRNPAQMAGLADRGRLEAGLRADVVRFRIVEGTPVVRQVLVEAERVF
ncbi:alpha-D-ribose 1-methylphosphonate 5-triphosphate diphosphatase [Xanthobacter flavus]|uniref:Alpha-D-ribose 1-methylphosphonate 5-triphosphate diphosphatase n=1 Tax=Xanthobacter flavus TaxID=281 RepID=A0A9W6CMQ9_XANFL|nr:alpha-D-ribose 1-methylphosphonate 5-triphosphate diphosphatase [Xanthobacter flavus]MDR6333600.1 alpha-D-ribose 1-methylphosphonate 5-triphosphate diphosphatase [Xanthobacter flavus]GLI20648.1 amidohydrolase [Xanthobacter flavus]